MEVELNATDAATVFGLLDRLLASRSATA
jgi:hypothetical protein